MIWDRNDWQGKSKNQLKYSYYVVLYIQLGYIELYNWIKMGIL